jgi:methylmalonyl-CoA/ethylmalonyl-CoA epimerase
MRRILAERFPAPVWPEGIAVRTFEPGDAAGIHQLLEQAYAHGGGGVAPYAEWLPAMTGDSEFDAGLWFVALSGDEIAGVALCWTSAFVKDLAVSAAWRRRGLGTALLLHCFQAFADRGAEAIDLKVDSENPSEAWRLYEQLGFRLVERIHPSTNVTELRVALTVPDFDQAVAFYRDALCLEQVEDWSSDEGRVILLSAGKATIEILDEAQAGVVDSVEAGSRVSGAVRLAVHVLDSDAAAELLVGAGAESVAPPVTTPWGDRNARVRTPDGLQLTLFT